MHRNRYFIFFSSPDKKAEFMIRKAGRRIVNHQNAQGETPLHKAVFNPAVRFDFRVHNIYL